jgi:predicted O-methyltransferase YrrM
MRVLAHFALWRLGLATAETQTTAAERDCLAHHASGRKRLAEIGVWHGVTTSRLRQAMAPDAVLLAIDPYPAGRLGFSMPMVVARKEVSRVSNGSVKWLRQTSVAAASSLDRSETFDFVFIDGEHTYDGLQADWTAWSPRLVDGGTIGLHDSRSTPQRLIDDAGSVRFTTEVILNDPRFEVADTVDSLTVLRRKQGQVQIG